MRVIFKIKRWNDLKFVKLKEIVCVTKRVEYLQEYLHLAHIPKISGNWDHS